MIIIGSSLGVNDIYDQIEGLNLSQTVTGLPVDGRTLYVRLCWWISGSVHYTDYTYTAFTQTQNTYTLAVTPSPSAGGTVNGGGTFISGSSRTVTATANSGYTFDNWTEGGTQVSTSSSYTFTLNGNRNLVANFTQTQQTSITNGGFESSWTSWVHSGGATIGSDGSGPNGSAHTGNNFLWLGGDNGTDTAYQDVPIPSTATAANLSFYYNINSSEPTSYGAYDTFSVTIRDECGATP